MAEKTNDSVQVNLRITTNSNQGGRKYMEDAYAIALQRLNPSDKESPISLAYFGIFDGHGGEEAAEFARQNLCKHILEQDDFWATTSDENQKDQFILSAIHKGFLACHNDMWNHVGKWAKTSSGLPSTSGSTASVVFIRGNKLYIGHVGDSAIVLAEGENLHRPWSANRLTRDHKPEDPLELERIRDSGGNVLCKAGVYRVVWNRQKSNSNFSYRQRHQHSIAAAVATPSPSTTTTTITTTTATTTAANGATIEYEQIPFLAVSRALGDLWSLNTSTNRYSVSPEPELAVIEIDSTKHRCLILASDGLWNMISPETAVEIVRNCDIKTEEMILKSEDDDHRPFRNPSHELVQRALTLWRERMLRADNITCITVMLDPPGPPFSDCIVKKKKEKLTSSMSSSTASVCSDDTVDLDHLSPVPSTIASLQRIKPPLERKEHILTPISNGPTPVRTPKRPASEEGDALLVDTPRRKLLKTNPQKENGRTSPSTTDAEMPSSSPTLLQPITSTDTNEIEPQSLSSTQSQVSSASEIDDDELTRQIDPNFANNSEQKVEEYLKNLDQIPQNPSLNQETTDRERPSRLRRMRSASTTLPARNQTRTHSNPARRRRSTSNSHSLSNKSTLRKSDSNINQSS